MADDAEHEPAGPAQPGDWRTSPTTGELEFFDGRAWGRPRHHPDQPAAESDLLIRPVPPAERSPGTEDAAGSGAEPG